MKTLNQFIVEASGYNPISFDEMEKYKDIILKHDKYVKIYRGMKNTGDMILGDGESVERPSKNTFNYYTLLMSDILPAWKPYPKRSKSFICSTSTGKANLYGGSSGGYYIVIPLENQSIGVCPESDIWDSFNSTMTEIDQALPDLNYVLYAMFGGSGGIKFDTSGKTSEILLKSLNTLSQKILIIGARGEDDPYYYSDMWNFFYKKLAKGLTMTDILGMLLDPKKNNFELVKHKALINTVDSDEESYGNEVWLSGKVLFVNGKRYDDLIRSLSEDGIEI